MKPSKNEELQEKASRDHDEGHRDTPSTDRGLGDMIFGISQEYLDENAEAYNKIYDELDEE